MKYYKHLLFITISLLSLSTYAQTSKKTLNYQAVILDPKAIDIPGASIVGQPLNKGNVCLRFSLLNAQGGLDYEETQQVTTDEYGLVNVAIGAGAQAQAGNSTSIYKSFDSVLWNSSVKSLKVSVSYDGCNSFKQVSSQALNYTPYALYAEAVDYKNVREAPTKLSQFSNDAGYLIPKDLDPLKSDIQTNSSKIEVANKSIADNKQASDAAFLVVNQSISSLDTQVAANTTAIKENTSSISNINTKITDQQNQISDNRNQIAATNNNLNTQIGGLQGQLNTTNSTVNSLSGVAEVVSNKSTAINLGGANPSDQAYPSQKAAKAYIDNAIYDAVGSGVPDATTLAAGKVKLAGDLGGTAANPTVPALANKENTANKSLNVLADGTDNTKYPSVKAVKDYVDQATLGTALAADLANKANIASPAFTGVPTAPTPASSDNSTKLATTAFVQAATAGIALQASVDGKADKISPTFTGTPTAPTPTLGDNSTKLATTAYVDAQVSAGAADATTTSKGIVRLTGDLGGTATSPTVPGLLLKEDVLNKSNAALGTSTTLYPTQNAVKTYVDAQVASATIADADATTKGKLQLTGDLGGTASSPTVPGLTAKANIASPTFTGTVTSPIYASAPQNLTDAATISWNPANGLNANVTLGGNRTLSFSATPTSGSYGTLVVTQDATGGRTLTLPSGTNKVLGSASTTTIALSSAANAKDILNFYYDGLTSTYYWNVGQGYGIAETIESTNLASAVTGTLPVANGGTGATTAAAALTSFGAQSTANLSTDVATDAASTSKYPAVKTIKDYVDAQILSGAPDATTSLKGKIQLAGDLAGSATSPSVVKLRGTALSTVAPVTAGHVLTYDATGSGVAYWAAPANSANTIAGQVPVANGGTGMASLAINGAIYASSATTMTSGTLPITHGGTGAITKQTAFDALSPMTSAGDIMYGGLNGTGTRLGKGNNFSFLTLDAGGLPTWTNAIRATAGSSYNAAVGFSFIGGDWAKNTGMFSDNPDSGGSATLKFRIATSNSTADPYLEISPTKVSIYPTTSSTSKTTGALTVAGGLGVNGNIYASNLDVSGAITAGTWSATTIAVANGGTGATTAAAALTALGAAPLASPTFTGTLTAPIYASAPQNLTDAATISWNPASGLNASVTLGGNRTLSFSTAPASGSYGTLVVTQDATGGRTLTLPSGTNKVLGSISTTTISLSAAANAKDILNFYFDGTTYFWNVGQGYGTAATITANNIAGGAAGSIPYQTGAGATGFLAKGNDGQILTLASGVPSWAAASATGVTSVSMTTPTGLSVSGSPITSSGTLALSLSTGYAIPTTTSQTNWDAAYSNRITSANSPLSITSNALSLATVPVSSGGTGATTLTSGSLLKGNGTSAISAATAGTDYSAGTSTLLTGILKSTTITGALTIAAASDFPTLNQNTTGNASTATKLAASKNINGVAFDGSSDITVTAAAGTLSGTVAVANGGTGLTSTPGNGQIDIGNGSGFTRANLTPGTAITITNASGAITISAAIRPTSDEFTATAGQTAFTLSQTPLTNTTTSPVKPNVWMFINGVRTKNLAYAVSGTSVTYTASSNNSYTLVAGDRIQFDYAY